MDNIERFKQIISEMSDTYEKKNHDYGNSFETTLNKWGCNIAFARIEDKLNRASVLMHDQAMVNDESINDTLKDLATYAVMTLIWYEKVTKNGLTAIQ